LNQDPVVYPYALGDLLESRNTYFYTPFLGKPFLQAWETQRVGILSAKGTPEPGPPSVSARKPTDGLLDTLHEAISRDPGAGSWPALDRLLQRFEVTKRIHGEYNDHWRPCDPADYAFLPRYLRFAEVLELAYEATSALPYLNGLLKCLDTLSALHATLQPDAKGRLDDLIAKEREHVQKLCRRLPGGAVGA
jgi:methionyl-tRNA formyltransferase